MVFAITVNVPAGFSLAAGQPRSVPMFHRPSAIAVGAGKVWVADSVDGSVARLSLSGARETCGLWGRAGRFARPTGIALAPKQGVVYVAEAGLRQIRILGLDGRPRATVGVSVPAMKVWPASDIVLAAGLNGNAIAVVRDGVRLSVQRFSPGGRLLSRWHVRLRHRVDLSYQGPLGPNPLDFGGLVPLGVAVTSLGEIDVHFAAVAAGGGRDEVSRAWYFVQRRTSSGLFIRELRVGRDPNGTPVPPSGLAVLPSGDLLVPDATGSRILRISPSDAKSWITPQPGCFHPPLSPAGIAVDGRGRLLVANWRDANVRVFSQSGTLLGVWGGCPDAP